MANNHKVGASQVNKIMYGSIVAWNEFTPIEPEEGVDLIWDIAESASLNTEVRVVVSAATIAHIDKGNGTWEDYNIAVSAPFDSVFVKNGPGKIRFKIDSGTIVSVEFNRTTTKNIISAAIDGTKIDDCAEMFMGQQYLRSFRARDMVHAGEYTRMFMNCTSLEDVVTFTSSNANSMESMFENCTSLKVYPVIPVAGKANVSKYVKNTGIVHAPDIAFYAGTEYSEFFADCKSLQTVGRVSSTSGASYNSFFSGCSNLTCIRSIDTVSPSTDMFTGCIMLTSPDPTKQAELSAGNSSYVNDGCIGDTNYLSPEPGTLFTLYLDPARNIYLDIKFDIDTNAVLSKDLGNGIFEDTDVTPGTVYCRGTMNGNNPIRVKLSAGNITNLEFNSTYGDNVKQLAVDATRIDSFNSIMRSQSALVSFSAINVSHITNCYFAFDGTTILDNLDLDTSNVTNFHTFLGYSGFQDISSLDFSSATDIGSAFYNMPNLTVVGDITAPNATDISHIFQGCINLTHIGIVTTAANADHSDAYRYCPKLVCIKGIDTSTATSSSGMFTDDNLLASPGPANQSAIEGKSVWLAPACDNTNT